MTPPIRWAPLAGALPASQADVARLEAEIRHTLPPDYAAWLRQHNGGKPLPDYWQFEARWSGELAGLDQTMELYALYGQGPQEGNLVARWQALADRVPPAALPIGDAVSPVLLLLLDGPQRGQVKLWLPDTAPQHDQTQAAQLGHVADSFAAFLGSLSCIAG